MKGVTSCHKKHSPGPLGRRLERHVNVCQNTLPVLEAALHLVRSLPGSIARESCGQQPGPLPGTFIPSVPGERPICEDTSQEVLCLRVYKHTFRF